MIEIPTDDPGSVQVTVEFDPATGYGTVELRTWQNKTRRTFRAAVCGRYTRNRFRRSRTKLNGVQAVLYEEIKQP